MRLSRWILALVAALGLVATSQAAPEKVEVPSFGALEGVSAEAARTQALTWLKQVKGDAATLQQFDRIWKQNERTVLERVADTLALGNPTAAKLLADARDPSIPAPTTVPALLKDEKQSAFFRNNLGLAYARVLVQGRVHEEALDTLKIVKIDQVVDPATYLFNRAVCEYSLLQRDDARKSINRLLDEVVSPAERYKTVSALMLLDMQLWKDKDLAAVTRKMDVVERRLDLARGGPQTQKIQKDIIARLDELIKEKENQAKKKQQGQGEPKPGQGGQECPDGGQPGPGSGSTPGNNPTSPMQDTNLNPGGGGTGKVDEAKMRKLAAGWGAMPERERARALQELTRGLSPTHREAIENYFRNLARAQVRR